MNDMNALVAAPTTNDKATANDPLWFKDAVIYQLHVKSFADSNNDGIGDFKGLMDKLDYISELGVDAVWLLPFYPSPRRDDGYDISEYKAVHDDYGNMADARKFIEAAHERGIKVITELVINHTSDQHPWFQRARKAKPGSAARNFYVWADNDQGYNETRIIFCDTEPSNWTWDPVANAYYWHRFYAHQPDLNFDNPQVLKAVLGIMRFWLEAGIDGLRLDAVPYLIEREGTSNENLPETHVILKKIRADLEARFPDRMLLAEANMWPEDVQEYFGKGDECHMAFHFPLMPRMYMAIAQEDRFPIIDIMRQTPEIPENCQWAIFLRNHDELTLEMVTDKERDYLWQTYASEKRARINLGIRRRLSPLMERDRRRIELMNCLLLSMPGTPVIYYGDEIGMGDNIHLGDRDGVRTPMQWTPDRNGGFSRADPERMVLPALQGTLYGYEAVNVEAQERDQHSLLNWMRRMIAIRRQHRAFGRGKIQFLAPRNRKVLAYLRTYESTNILCVANLSRSPQAVELDLSAFAGHVPVELSGGTPFPPIGQLSYLLTLPPYGFYWFSLCTSTQLPASYQKPPEMLPEFLTLVFRNNPTEIMGDATRRIVEQEILPAYLPMRRWFGAKDKKLTATRVVYATPLPHTEVALAEVAATADGETERYLLPVGIAWDEATLAALPQQLALSRVRKSRRIGFLTDAFAMESFARAVLVNLRDAAKLQSSDGEIQFKPTAKLTEVNIPDDAPIQWLSAEQSNSSLVYEYSGVLKLVRRVNAGVHPEAEVTRYLTEAGYANTAPLLGEVVRVSADGEQHTLMILQGYLYNEGDAWRWTMDYLRRSLEELTVKADDAAIAKVLAGYADFAGNIGQRLGELHAVLAQPTDNADFAPEAATSDDFQYWAKETATHLTEALDILAARSEWSDTVAQQQATTILQKREALIAAIDGFASLRGTALRTRIHGDFHLGQVLVSRGDSYIIDFEGEPRKPLSERRRKSTPMRDVAGLLRSLDYAVAAVAAEPERLPPQLARERVEVLLQGFRDSAEQAFLSRYLAVAQQAAHPWVSAETQQSLIDLFLIDKVAYEVGYEAANRPHWIGLPVRGLARLTERLLGAGEVNNG